MEPPSARLRPGPRARSSKIPGPSRELNRLSTINEDPLSWIPVACTNADLGWLTLNMLNHKPKGQKEIISFMTFHQFS